MPEIGGVWYGDHAYEHMQRLAEQTVLLDEDSDPALMNEAKVIHAFHEEFPGIVMKDGDTE